MAAITRRAATEEDLLNTPDDGIYELVDGEIRTSPGGCLHSVTSLAIAARLATFVWPRRLGHVFGANTGCRLPGGNVRCPDVTFIASGRFPDDKVPEEFASLAPDLTVEVISPRDRPRWVLDKVGEYLEVGVRLVWVVDPETRRATIYRSLSDVRTIAEGEFLDGEDVVPGFRCRLSDVLD